MTGGRHMGKTNRGKIVLSKIFTLSNKIQIVGDRLETGITIKQFQLLETLSKNDPASMTITELSEALGSSRQNIKKMALLLEKQNYLVLSKDDTDGRIVRVALTEEGKNSLQQQAESDKEFINQLFDGFDDKLLKNMSKGFDKLSKNILLMEEKTNNPDVSQETIKPL